MSALRERAAATSVERVSARVVTVPTDLPEQDGTISWDATTMVLVSAQADGVVGYGYSYAEPAAADVIGAKLAPLACGGDAMAITASWWAMQREVRNAGRPGLCSAAISAVDIALWDLKARLVDMPLAALLGTARDAVPVYGSGGFTSYGDAELRRQLSGWVGQGIGAVKMKVGAHPEDDLRRIGLARDAIGPDAELFIDANGAYERKQALAIADQAQELGVTWFEEPVSSDDLEGLRLLRDRAPAPIRIAAGEYGYDGRYFRRMLAAGAVDVLQADGTRCLGVTGFMQAAALAGAFEVPISAHTAPALHLHTCAAVGGALAPLEWFHDHVRIESMLFDGAPQPRNGAITVDTSRPGLGLEPREEEIERHAA